MPDAPYPRKNKTPSGLPDGVSKKRY